MATAAALSPKSFFILGSPVGKSKSPALHNTAFALHKLPYNYRVEDCAELTEREISLIRDDDFGGCAVTMPHKLAIGKHLDEITPIAKTLGAINTVIPKVDPATGRVRLIGDNTDYIGISDCLTSSLIPSHDFQQGKSAGLVIGAGGAGRAAIYALHSIGCGTVYLFNRTESTANAVAASFPSSYNIKVITSTVSSSFTEGYPIFIIGTIPASTTSTHQVPAAEGASTLYVDSGALIREKGGVMLDMSYLPRNTPLLQLAWARKDGNWVTQTGIDVLIKQGFAQFTMWTGLEAPKEDMAAAVMKAYDEENPV